MMDTFITSVYFFPKPLLVQCCFLARLCCTSVDSVKPLAGVYIASPACLVLRMRNN